MEFHPVGATRELVSFLQLSKLLLGNCCPTPSWAKVRVVQQTKSSVKSKNFFILRFCFNGFWIKGCPFSSIKELANININL
jgi:hypothetical protein